MKLINLSIIISLYSSHPTLIKREEPFGLLASLVDNLQLPTVVKTMGLSKLNEYLPLTTLTDVLQVDAINNGLNYVVSAIRDNPGNDVLGLGKIIKTLKGEVEEEAIDESGLDGEDIDTIVKQAGVSRKQAVDALRRNKGDVLNSIMDTKAEAN